MSLVERGGLAWKVSREATENEHLPLVAFNNSFMKPKSRWEGGVRSGRAAATESPSLVMQKAKVQLSLVSRRA